MDQRDGKVLDVLFKAGPLSNQELAARLGISPSAVSNATTRLVRAGAITAVDADGFRGEAQPGRRRKRTYRLNPAYATAVVVEIDFDFVTLHLIRFDLSPVVSRRVPIAHNERDSILDTIDAELSVLVGSAENISLCGIGFSMPGQVDFHNGIAIHNTRIDNWDNVDFRRFAVFSRNIVTENVANAVALGEYARGSAREIDDFVLLHVGNGAGMGIVIGGALHRGHNYAAGEAGHVIIEESSKTTCACGNHGCLESFVSRRAVMQELERLRQSEVPSGILSDFDLHQGDGIYAVLGSYYESGDKVAYILMQELAHKLGLAAANFVQILAPARIVLSGPVINLGAPFLELVEQSLRRYQLPWLPPIPVVYGGDAVLAAAQGTALLVFQRGWEAGATRRGGGVPGAGDGYPAVPPRTAASGL